jgi:hypothetical protein
MQSSRTLTIRARRSVAQKMRAISITFVKFVRAVDDIVL